MLQEAVCYFYRNAVSIAVQFFQAYSFIRLEKESIMLRIQPTSLIGPMNSMLCRTIAAYVATEYDIFWKADYIRGMAQIVFWQE